METSWEVSLLQHSWLIPQSHMCLTPWWHLSSHPFFFFKHSYGIKWIGIQQSLLGRQDPEKHDNKNWDLWWSVRVLRSLRSILFNGCHQGEPRPWVTKEVAKNILRSRDCSEFMRQINLSPFYVTSNFQEATCTGSSKYWETIGLTESTKSTTHFAIMFLWSRRLGQSFLLNNLTSQYQPTYVLQPIPLRSNAAIADSRQSSKMAKYLTGIRTLTFNILLVLLFLPLCPYSMLALFS